MKRLLAVLLATFLILSVTGCATGELVSSSGIQQGTVSLPEGSGEEASGESSGEFPSSSESLPSDSDGQSGSPSGGQAAQSGQTHSGQQTQAPAEQQQATQKPAETPAETPSAPTSGEYRAVWISYLELKSMLTGKTESQFRSNISAAFSKAASLGLNTVLVHVRPFGDALYNSSVFPTSFLITGQEGDALPFDPLSVMVTEAHKQGLSIEAWINPYRVRAGSGRTLSAGNPAQKFLDSGSDAVYTYNGGVYYNPGSSEAVDLIVRGIKEIVSNYNVDGIHFDDYFYATTDSSIDSSLYSAYCSGGGTKSLANWRRANVNSMVREVYSAIKAIKPSVRFGISPQGNMNINYSSQYADVATWLGSSGYVDYICPQLYYGFNNASCPYNTVLEQFNSMIKVDSIKLYVGLAAYKIGTQDTYAGASGKTEWINNSDLLSRMVVSSRNASHCKGFALYSYNSIFNPSSSVKDQVKAELNALSSFL